MHLKNIIVLLLILTSSFESVGQNIEMTLSQIKERVLERNIDLKIAQQDYALKEADFLQSRAMYYPGVSLDYTGITTSSPLMVFGSKLNQSIISQSDFDPARLNDPSAVENFSFQLKVMQPILNFDKKHQRKAAKLGMDATLLQTERKKQYLDFASTQLFMQLQFTYKAVDVLEQALATALINQSHAQNNFDAGYLQKADLLQIDVRINELRNKILSTKNQIKDLSDQLHSLMQDDDFTIISPVEELELNIESAKTDISMNREDLLAMDKANQAYEEILKSEQKTFLPKFNAFAIFETNDNSPIAVNATNYLVGAQISWNIFDGHQRSAKIQRAKSQIEKGKLNKQKYLNENQIALQKTIRNSEQALVKLETVKLAIVQAEESLRIRTNRFEQGLEKASDVLMAETTYAQKKLLELQTILEFNISNLYVDFLGGSKQ